MAEKADIGSLYGAHIEEMTRRHDHALDLAGAEAVVIAAGEPFMAFQDDQAYPFVVNPNFNAWVPLTDAPGSHIVYRPGHRPLLAYCQPADYWHLPPAAPAGYWTEHVDVRIFSSPAEARGLLPDDLSGHVFIGEVREPVQALGIERINPAPLIRALHFARAKKTAYELACMRGASRAAVRGHLAASAAFEAGESEFGIHLAYCAAVGQLDSDLPYGNIVALNEHAAVLHYQHLDRDPPSARHSFLIDAGASHAGYAADITRTYAADGGDFAALIDAMGTLQQSVVGEVRAGVDFRDLHLETHRQLGRVLLDAGIADAGSAEALVEAGITRAFLPHGLGHLLGLQVHDVGGFMRDETGGEIPVPEGHPFLRLTRRLECDQVLTIEPGLYFIEMLLAPLRASTAGRLVDWGRVSELMPCGGIRIEDNVRVLEEGAENLTRDAFAAAA